MTLRACLMAQLAQGAYLYVWSLVFPDITMALPVVSICMAFAVLWRDVKRGYFFTGDWAMVMWFVFLAMSLNVVLAVVWVLVGGLFAITIGG